MINAKTAYTRTIENETQTKEVFNLIEAAIFEGKYSIEFTLLLSPRLKLYLASLGFRIVEEIDKTIITWNIDALN